MPEHETPDLADLDTAFAHLERDITTISSAPGAGAAVGRARRRRRTRIASVAAVTVLAVGGAALAQGVASRDHALEPTATLPSPAPLDANTLTSATQGWTPAWSAAPSQAEAVLNGPVSRCIDQSPVFAEVADPIRSSGDLSFTAGPASSYATLADFGSQARVLDHFWAGIGDTFNGCAHATVTGHEVWEGGEAVSYSVPADSGRTEHVWAVRAGSSLGLLWITKAAAAVPATTDADIASAVMAALLDPHSFTQAGDGSSTSSATVGMSEVSFARALGGWHSGWSATSGARDADSTPCGVDLTAGASFGEEQSLGGNGEQASYGFENVAAAQAAVQAIGHSMSACPTATYDVHSVPIQGGTVTVAAGTGSAADVVWLVRDGRQISYIVVPAGDTTPPDPVTAAVGELLAFDLRANAAATQQSSTPQTTTSKNATPVH
jgi:hypothetical protein